MGKQGKTGISWTDATWNPIRGCTRVSPGCVNCYAERVAARFSGPGQPYEGLASMTASGPRWTGKVRMVPEHLEDPLRWTKPRMVFVNSMSDLFHEDLEDHQIGEIFAVMAQAKRHTFQVLTKRADRMQEVLSCANDVYGPFDVWPLPNVWIGVSVENQDAARFRIPLLLKTPAAVRWISAEPLLGPLDLKVAPIGQWPDRSKWMPNKDEYDDWKYWMHRDLGINWVVCGGESGFGARPMEVAWARSIRDQCVQAGVPFFMKQLGGAVDKKGAFDDLPADLKIRQYPTAVPAGN